MPTALATTTTIVAAEEYEIKLMRSIETPQQQQLIQPSM
jgi:hypothetical protein